MVCLDNIIRVSHLIAHRCIHIDIFYFIGYGIAEEFTPTPRLSSRNKKWAKDQDGRPGATHKKAKYTSNKTHYSPTDPDARISVKPRKVRKLND